MPLKEYGVLRGRPTQAKVENDASSPHYQVLVEAMGIKYRIAINVKSQKSPSELLYLINHDFKHPILPEVNAVSEGFTQIPSKKGGIALDFIRGNLFDRGAMKPLPHNVPGPANDLNELLDAIIKQAITDASASIFLFGERWGPEPTTPDKVFGFKPGNGIHDIHMNQGNVGSFVKDDGVWQDGGILIHFADADRWAAVFLAFQSQAWHTDDTTGHTIDETTPQPLPGVADAQVRIIAALVNPVGPEPGAETVTLLNASDTLVDLSNWGIINVQNAKHSLVGSLAPGGVLTITLGTGVPLGNKGGTITLVNSAGLKVHGVSYTKAQASKEGWQVVF